MNFRGTSRVDIEPKVEKRMGRWQLLGRYHKMPRKLEDDYVMESRVLGTGLNGSVKLARALSDTQERQYAVKRFNTSRMSLKSKQSLESEVQVYLCMDHPHVARLVNVYETPESLSLVMECMEGGELFDRVTELKKFTEPNASQVTRQMLLAVNYLHSHGIVHRDLKLENFLYDMKGGNFLKLIDFGFSRFRDPDAKLKTACGTLSYVAPEVLCDGGYGAQCDLWSLGVIVFVLLAGHMPFSGNDQNQRDKILAGRYNMKPERWSSISKEAKNFTQSLLKTDPAVRLTANAALKHPWITSYNTSLDDGAIGLDSTCVNSLRAFGQASTFKRVCLKAMAWLLSNEETEQVRQQFAALDVDCGGTISLTELQDVLLDRCNLAKSDVNAIFRAVDMNHDDEINYSEFLAAMLSASININDQLLQTAFRHFDTDLSGYITSDDLREVLGGHVFEGKTTEALIQDADVLKDGRISFPEFAAFMRDEPLKTPPLLFDEPSQMTVTIEELEDSRIEKAPPCCCVQ